jgi:hypothetical protein
MGCHANGFRHDSLPEPSNQDITEIEPHDLTVRANPELLAVELEVCNADGIGFLVPIDQHAVLDVAVALIRAHERLCGEGGEQ